MRVFGKRIRLNDFHYLTLTCLLGLAIATLLLVALIYKNEIDNSVLEILNN
jgi:hypothetical protein